MPSVTPNGISSRRYRDPMYCLRREWPQNARNDAESGDVQAQLYLAMQSFNLSQHSAETLHYWYKKAAVQGNPEAMANLVQLYRFGNGGEGEFNTTEVFKMQDCKILFSTLLDSTL